MDGARLANTRTTGRLRSAACHRQKRLWRRGKPACAARTWSEESDRAAPRAVLTERARAEIARRVGPAEHSVAQAAWDFGGSWHAAMAAVSGHGRPRVDHLARLGAPVGCGGEERRLIQPHRADAASDRDHRSRRRSPQLCSPYSKPCRGHGLAGG
jgi:hypothetical protein